MAISKAVIFLLLFCLILVDEIRGDEQWNRVPGAKIDCQSKCEYRCSKTSRHKMCMRACNTCCQRCNCVPPGTAGNENVCPCYANMTTHGGRHKCP